MNEHNSKKYKRTIFKFKNITAKSCCYQVNAIEVPKITLFKDGVVIKSIDKFALHAAKRYFRM